MTKKATRKAVARKRHEQAAKRREARKEKDRQSIVLMERKAEEHTPAPVGRRIQIGEPTVLDVTELIFPIDFFGMFFTGLPSVSSRYPKTAQEAFTEDRRTLEGDAFLMAGDWMQGMGLLTSPKLIEHK